jgi:hypothetical protein
MERGKIKFEGSKPFFLIGEIDKMLLMWYFGIVYKIMGKKYLFFIAD